MINYITGDAILSPEVARPKILFHICNNCGQWGSGFVVPLGKKYPKARSEYLDWAETQIQPFELGNIQLVKVEQGMLVCNAIAQDNKKWVSGEPPCKFNHLETCLKKVASFVHDKQPFFDKPISIVMPRIGCGIGQAKWEDVEKIIESQLCSTGIQVYVYTLPNEVHLFS